MQTKGVLITGGSRGIGAACVRAFAGAGYRVVFCYRSAQAQADALCAALPGVTAVQADLSSSAQADRLVLLAEETLGGVDVLINNAGVSSHGLLQDVSDDEWRRIFSNNIDPVFYCTRAVLPGMIRRQRGSIVNLSSIWGQVGGSCETAYSAAKAAVIGLTRALAKETGPSGIRVNCIAPGVIDTDMNAALSPEDRAALCEETPLGRIGTPEEAAQAALFLASDAASFITGQALGVNGGFVI